MFCAYGPLSTTIPLVPPDLSVAPVGVVLIVPLVTS